MIDTCLYMHIMQYINKLQFSKIEFLAEKLNVI